MAEPDPPAAARMFLLVIEGGADPAGGRGGHGSAATPLQEAGTPALDRLARDGHLHRVVLGAATCWDGFTGLLGADPGTAPLGPAEAAAAGIDADGWAARADFVTVDDSGVLDPLGGHVADPEASALLAQAAGAGGAADASAPGGLVRLRGHRNLWVSATEVGASPPAWQTGSRTPRSVLSPDAGLMAFYDDARSILGKADINAVRVDLGENPANALWPHGAGELPLRMTPPAWAVGRRVALVAAPGPAQGVARVLGWHAVAVDGDDDALCAAALEALADHDVVVVRTRSVLTASLRSQAAPADAAASDDVRASGGHEHDVHGARVEALSAVDARLAGPLLSALEERGPFVFAVAADGAVDLRQRLHSAEPVPCGTLHSDGLGSGGSSGAGLPAFNERACTESGHRVEGAAEFAALLAHELDAVSGTS
jgi:2,3-bisphosphoglycerate-independent phosphoglycerate mutase